MESLWREQTLAEDCETGRIEIGYGESAVLEPRSGYGACSKCSCQAYMGSGDLCENCQHNYSFHW
jgi:hypothetical protein